MTDRRANSQPPDGSRAGADLHLDLSGSRGRADLVAALHASIRSGRLVPGTRLPSSRTLAQDLGIARNTVADAYGQLVAEGWLTARQGSGTVVAGRPGVVLAASPPAPIHQRRFRYDLTPGSPDLATFPRAEWLAAARKALTSAPNDAFGYGDPRGRPELRRMLADYLARARGVHADPERILICSGYVQALSLLSEVLQRQGATTLSVEEFGYRLHWDVIRSRGLTPVPVTVDEHGVRTGQLTGEAALLTPAHQMPTGVPLAPERRTAAIEWARETGAVLIEDDYDGEFRYDRQTVGALQTLDPERVVYTGTASKSLAPGLRLAWMVVPQHLMEPLLAAKRTADLQTATLDQLVLAEYIASGHYDRHVRRSRLHYRRRRDRLVELLATRAPGVRVAGISAGLHVLLDVPGDAQDMVDRGVRQGLRLIALHRYHFTEDSGRQALVVGYGTPPDHAYSGALDLLCQILDV
ncbi:transcriptional regulator, GntR family with aminotransferase domain protein [Kribbella flavida DSM 17836]|uniref:Transcriptional regulator, GntR family with aminotransferase domain protein n=1 Tax=Kribbella flavida (strain DSM 17836 / JCM 10339 / NBRC 14399) TaxID=479435 RepID=D2Q3A9_KRIFD|nr:aminotransferase class I/II-fold pyridoxal phosphate-dependent enzyme [Kribbella flavida]ADB34032.1 transcriptional regulator, GntR family with aminotransferase domain protein [Kribbella flavida DSM 17836]